jgi:hypothetical protein
VSAEKKEKDNAETQRTQRFAEEFMNKDRRTVFRFAAVGLGVFVAWVIYQMLTNPSPWSPLNNLLSAMFMILCPPVLLTIPLMDDEIGTRGIYVVWMIVAVLNAALYAAIGSAYVGKRKKREGEATN